MASDITTTEDDLEVGADVSGEVPVDAGLAARRQAGLAFLAQQGVIDGGPGQVAPVQPVAPVQQQRPAANAPPLPYAALQKRLADIGVAQTVLQNQLLGGAGATEAVSDFATVTPAGARHMQAVAFAAALGDVGAHYAKYHDLDAQVATGLQTAIADESQGQAVQPSSKAWKKLADDINRQRHALREKGLPANYAAGSGIDQNPWWDDLISELGPFTQGTDGDDNERLRSAANASAPTAADRTQASAAGATIKASTEKYMVRGAARSSVYFDAGRNGVVMSLDDQNASYAANDKLVKLGMNILNNGGSYAKVQELMAGTGLGEESWPPQLVQSVQAWRKTQRALNDERAREWAQKNILKDPSGTSITDPEGLEQLKSAREMLDSGVGIMKDAAELAEIVREYQEKLEEARKKAEELAAASAEALGDAVKDTAAKGADASETAKKATEPTAEATKAISAAAWANGIGAGINGLLGLVQIVQGGLDFYAALTDDEMPGREKMVALLSASLDALMGATRTAKDGMQMAKDFGGTHIAEVMAKVIPGLNIAFAGMECAKSMIEVAEGLETLSKARGLKRDAQADFAKEDGDEALLNVASNDSGAAKTKLAKSSVEAAANFIELGGAIAGTAGGAHGAAAGAALSITAGAIKLGSKVIFAGIDFASAKKAMNTIKDAQAGNYQAQVEVFEDSNFYAKMYLAIMVKEGNPIATKYLVNQGLEEGDLDNATSLGILRDLMLESSEQSNDLEADDTVIGKMVEAGSKVLEVGGDIADGLRSLTKEDVAKGAATFVLAGGVLAPVTLTLMDFVKKNTGPIYDPDAKYPTVGFQGIDITDWPGRWEQAKATHVEHGLLPDATGLGATLTKAAKADAEAARAMALPNNEPDRAKIIRVALTAAIEAMKAVAALTETVKLRGFDAGSTMPKKVPHQQAYASMLSLRTAAYAAIIEYWKRFDATSGGQDGWDPPGITAIDGTAWQAFWSDGADKAGFPADDGGVAKAIGVALALKQKFESESDNKKKHKRALEYTTALDDVNEAALAAIAVPEVSRLPKAKAAVTALMLLLNTARRELDNDIAGTAGNAQLAPWASPAGTFDQLEPDEYYAAWKQVWKYALDGGYTASDDDVGLGDAIKAFDASHAAMEKAADKAKDKLKAIRAMEVNAGAVKKHAIEFNRKHRYANEALKAYVNKARAEVVKAAAAATQIDNARAAGVAFFHVPKEDPKYLSEKEWRRAYREAVDGGAVLESKTAKRKLQETLKKLKEKRESFEKKEKKNVKPEKLREAAGSYQESLNAALAAAEMTKGLKRYGENALMKGYLDGIAAAVETALGDTTLTGALA